MIKDLSLLVGVVALTLTGPALAQASQAGEGDGLVEAPGVEKVRIFCSTCHSAMYAPRSAGFTRDGWNELVSHMIDFSEQPEIESEIVDYLAVNYPRNDQHNAVLVDGPLKLSFKEWRVPTMGQLARDPVEATDGSLWWAGQFLSIVGRLDPETGVMKEYKLEPDAKPHSVTPGPDGGIWYSGNGNGTVGRIDPETDDIQIFKMPDPEALDPHTMEFDRKGILWFTVQHANMIGRLDPKTGEIELVKLPRQRSRPYGIKIDSGGAPWVSCMGQNCLIQVDPETMALREVMLPTGSLSRRLDIAEDGMIWYVNSGLGKLGRYNPKTGDIKEWESPSGSHSHPYAISVVDGMVWYNESNIRPDMLVRFNPKTEVFQSWAVPPVDGLYSGVLRHMRPTRDGKMVIHNGSTNRIMLVTLPKAD